MHSPRSKKVAGGPPPTTMPQPQQKRSSLRYSLNNIGKALADVVGKESKGSSVSHSRIPSSAQHHIADRSVTASSLSVDPPVRSRRPSIAGAFGSTDNVSAPPTRAPSQAYTRSRAISTTKQHVASTPSPKRASPAKLAAAAALPVTRRRSLLVKGALAVPAAAPAPAPTATPVGPAPIGTTKMLIRPKAAIPRATEDDRTIEVKERLAESPRATHAAVGRTRERHDSRASPVRTPSALSIPTPKGRASPVRTNSNDQTPNAKDERERRRERREREKQAQEEKERERREAKEREKERDRTKQVEAENTREAVSQRIPSGHRISSSTTTLTSASSIFTGGRSSTGDSQSSTSGSARPSPQVSKAQAVFPRAAQVVLTPPDDEEEDEDITISTPATRSRTVTGSTNFGGDISTPAISKTLLASISAQTDSPILAPLDQRLRHSGSIPSLSSGIPSPIHLGSMPFPPPANMRAGGAAANKGNGDDDDEEWEEGDVSAILATCASPVKGQSTPAMPRFAVKSSRSRAMDPHTPSRAGLPTREALSYVSPAMPAPGQRVKGDKAGNKASHLAPLQLHRAPRESILSWDALVERSRLEEGELEDMLRAPDPAVGLVSPDMRPARSLPPLAEMTMRAKRMNLGGMSDSEAEIEEEREVEIQGERFFTSGSDKTVNASSGGQSISQVLFPPPTSPEKKSKSRAKEREREMAEKERAWAAKEEAWRAQQVEWESERAKWESERGQWDAQQSQWSIQRNQWNAQQVKWAAQQSQWETREAEWAAREMELTQAVQARDDDLEALGQESSAHISELAKQSSAYETLKQQVEKHSQELRAARERDAKAETQMRCLGAMNAWGGVLGSLKADKEACAADRAALKVILLGLEAMTPSPQKQDQIKT
ncbi:hypothetical protein FRC10_007527 [Ceratobasidium sp. 414]|nr:hypothetical protein FRC10_007527 [Ceratobasidium sp. 414]